MGLQAEHLHGLHADPYSHYPERTAKRNELFLANYLIEVQARLFSKDEKHPDYSLYLSYAYLSFQRFSA
jgi:hypothetical protein